MFSLIHTECLLGACQGTAWEGGKRGIIILPEVEPEVRKETRKGFGGLEWRENKATFSRLPTLSCPQLQNPLAHML